MGKTMIGNCPFCGMEVEFEDGGLCPGCGQTDLDEVDNWHEEEDDDNN